MPGLGGGHLCLPTPPTKELCEPLCGVSAGAHGEAAISGVLTRAAASGLLWSCVCAEPSPLPRVCCEDSCGPRVSAETLWELRWKEWSQDCWAVLQAVETSADT